MGQPYQGKRLDDNQIFQPEDLKLLKELCQQEGDEENVHFQLIRELLHLEQQHRTMARRAGLYDALDKALERNAFTNAQEAEEFALRRQTAIAQARGENDIMPTDNLPLFS
jgi:DNA sulfur modification protein DndC